MTLPTQLKWINSDNRLYCLLDDKIKNWEDWLTSPCKDLEDKIPGDMLLNDEEDFKVYRYLYSLPDLEVR